MSFASILLLLFMIMFWLFRIVVAFTATMGMNFAFKPLEMNMEIILLFVTLLSILLVGKRKLIGALVYLLAYGMYFGTNLITGITALTTGTIEITTSNVSIYMNTFISLIGIAIPVAVLFDLLLDKNRKANPKDKKTDWFYKNEQFDRKMDERADKNNYRTLWWFLVILGMPVVVRTLSEPTDK